MFVTKIQKPQFCAKWAMLSVHMGADLTILPHGVGKGCVCVQNVTVVLYCRRFSFYSERERGKSTYVFGCGVAQRADNVFFFRLAYGPVFCRAVGSQQRPNEHPYQRDDAACVEHGRPACRATGQNASRGEHGQRTELCAAEHERNQTGFFGCRRPFRQQYVYRREYQTL